MYANHESSDHDAWCKSMDNAKATENPGKTSNESSTPAAASVSTQNLALNDKL
jgi:hypothetical protein